MKKFIIAFLVIILIGATAFGIIYYRKLHTGSGNISGDIPGLETGEKTSQEYLELIDQYTKEVNDLKIKLADITTKYDTDVNSCQAQIINLQKELLELKTTDEALINEKNEKIAELETQITTIQAEKEEASKESKEQISRLEKIISDYEVKVIDTIKFPEDFVFEDLGFSVIDNESFVFYSSSDNCNLYYYSLTTKQLETIPIKGTEFRSFYKVDNYLFFCLSTSMYVYDFNTKDITLLSTLFSSSISSFAFVHDDTNVYVFGPGYTYLVFNKSTKKFNTNFSSIDFVTDVLALMKDNQIVVLTRFKRSLTSGGTAYDPKVLMFDKDTYTFTTIGPDSYTSSLTSDAGVSVSSSSFNLFSINDTVFVHLGFDLFKLNITEKTINKIHTFSSLDRYVSSFSSLENTMLVYTNSGLYLYVDNQLKQISSEFNTKYPCTSYLYYFTKIAENTYYIYGYYGLYKINLEDYSFTSLSSNVGNWYIDNFDINNYKIIVSQKYYYIINTETGEVSTLEVGHGTLQSFVKLEYKDYVIFYSKYDSYLYYFNTTTNTYGRIKAGWNYMFMSPQVMIKADKVYILDELGFYVLDINDLSPNEPLVYFNNIDSSMSSLTRGEIYSKVGTLDGSNLYVKYILQEDGTFVKELVII